MKKTNKSNCPSCLSDYAKNNPNALWEDFKADKQGQSYNVVKLQTIQDQGNLCAYCETPYQNKPEKFSIEHFHPKSDTSNPAKNWHLDWNNFLAVCKGGRVQDVNSPIPYPTPENLSCDAYKDHLVTKNRLLENCEGYLFNPLTLPEVKIFKFNKSNGALEVDVEACAKVNFLGCNHFASFAEFAEETLQALNLNCQRLCDARLKVLIFYNSKIKDARLKNNKQIHQQLAQQWFNKPWPSFFTTRRDLLGKAAENHLKSTHYNG